MKRTGRRNEWLCLCALAGLGLLGGCNVMEGMRALAAYSAPTTEKIPAEFEGLDKGKAVVYVWAPPETLWDYPQLRLDLSAHLMAYLKENIKELEVIPAPQVETYVKSLSSMNPDAGEIGRHFHADKVIHISIYKFSLRDPGMSQFYRGRISGSVVVQDLSAKDGTVKRTPLQDVVITVPEDGLVGYYNTTADQVRDMVYKEFTQATGRKFHNWEKEVK